MSPDEFEKHLQRQPLRRVPDEWRAEILQNAKPARPSTPDPRPSFLSSILWPHPKAWAGLAAVWMALIIVHFAASGSTSSVEKKAEAPSPQTLAVFEQQQQMLAELIGQRSPSHEADRPKRIFQPPRSERRREALLA